jgi:endoglucanase
VVEDCLAVMDICTALEYYPSIFSDDIIISFSGNKIPDILDEAIYEVEWLLKMQNQKTGGVYASVVYSEEDSQVKVVSETTKATAYFAACMAKFSITVKKYDAELSKKAFQAATLAWKCLEANKDIVTNEQRFRAAVEMYRASGSGVYNRVILDYLKDNADKAFESDSVLDGAITYLNTTRSVDMDYCTSLMSTFMDRTEEKINLAELNPYGIESEELSAEELLRNMFELIIVDYIISSNAYTETEEDYMHYLCGRNLKSAYLIDDINTPDSLVRLAAFSAKLSAELEKEEDVK